MSPSVKLLSFDNEKNTNDKEMVIRRGDCNNEYGHYGLKSLVSL